MSVRPAKSIANALFFLGLYNAVMLTGDWIRFMIS